MTPQNYLEDTIIAIATPPGEGGVGILRLSGPLAPEAAARVWVGNRPLAELQSHRLYLGDLFDPASLEKLDTGLVARMRSPRSYTGEEVVEIHAHGGPLLLNRLLQVFQGLGLRAAEPGEFTRRAFLNGKLDLLQAEAVAELIHAKSEAALRNARAQLEGRISAEVETMRRNLIQLRARVEAAIDFPEEEIEVLSFAQTLEELGVLEARLRLWLEKFQVGRLLREGVRLALVGRPNVGKSSLLNRLVGEERAIVHDQPGTTRDLVDGWMELEGISFRVVDTAGLREGQGEVEREGISRSKRAAAQADLVLWVLDASVPLTAEDRQVSTSLNGKTLLVWNKIDLAAGQGEFEGQRDFPMPAMLKGEVMVSARTGEGLAALRAAILSAVGLEAWRDREQAFLNNARHREAVLQGLAALERAREALCLRRPLECPAADLQSATHAMEALLGKVDSDDILSEIFSSFCIGK